MTVYIAACLRERHSDVYLALSTALRDNGVPLVEVPGTGSIWLRDWMPIRCGDHYVKFRHKADVVKWPFLHVPESCWQAIGWSDFDETPSIRADIGDKAIILDGGNVTRSPDGKRVIMCEQTLRDNVHSDLGMSWQYDIDLCKSELKSLLEAEIIWIPNEPGDDLGHSDGECAWASDDTVLINDYRSLRDPEWSAYSNHLRELFNYRGITTVPFPNAYDLCRDIDEARFRKEHPQADEFNMATGYYINFSQGRHPNPLPNLRNRPRRALP